MPAAVAQRVAPHRHVLRAADYDAGTFVPPIRAAAGKTLAPTVDINVTYSGFSTQARQAFEYAVSLWEAHLMSPVTVQVEATFEPLEEDVLGSAGPRLTANFSASAFDDTWYPTAIADALVGQNVDTGSADIIASFNSEFDSWYFGTDGQTPTGQYDFVSVVLHELGHGLGFTGSFDVEDGDSDEDECNTDEIGAGCWGLSTSTGRQRFPLIYDRFVEDAQERPLIDTGVYPNPSRALGDVLQSGAVFFDGVTARSVHEDIPVDLYAPVSFERGSSFSHLDEQTFRPGTPNSLMTPFLAASEAIHSPGAVTCAILKDLGWPMGDGCQALFFAGLSAAGVEASGDSAVVTFEVQPDASIDSVIVSIGRSGAASEVVEEVDVDAMATSVQRFEVVIPDLEPGRYQVHLTIISTEQLALPGPDLIVIIPLDERFRVGLPYPNPASDEVTITLMVRDNQTVRIEVYDATGRRIETLLRGMMNRNEELRLTLDVRAYPAGVYFILVRGEDFSATRQFVRVR
ncbi:MAG TPA: T9SS type A sorting domain-containing protein [Rhodothermales bacterium]